VIASILQSSDTPGVSIKTRFLFASLINPTPAVPLLRIVYSTDSALDSARKGQLIARGGKATAAKAVKFQKLRVGKPLARERGAIAPIQPLSGLNVFPRQLLEK
jgi:hypothetical protein